MYATGDFTPPNQDGLTREELLLSGDKHHKCPVGCRVATDTENVVSHVVAGNPWGAAALILKSQNGLGCFAAYKKATAIDKNFWDRPGIRTVSVTATATAKAKATAKARATAPSGSISSNSNILQNV